MDNRHEMNPLEFLLESFGVNPEKAAWALIKIAALGLLLAESFRFGQFLAH